MRILAAAFFLLVLVFGIVVASPSFLAKPEPVSDWHWTYPSTVIYIKAWVDMNGTFGFETVPYVSIAPDPHFNAINAPLVFSPASSYNITAKPELYGYHFAFWQSEKTGLIYPHLSLLLPVGFESDSWWANYYR